MKPTHEQKMRKRAEANRQAVAADKRRQEIQEAARNARMSIRDYQFMQMMKRILG